MKTRGGGATTVVVRESAPLVRRASRRRSTSGQVGGFVSKHNIDMAMGGAVYGFLVKQGFVAKLPEIPILGRTGTAAIVLDWAAKSTRNELLGRAATAAAVIAGYQLGSEGKITGMTTAGDEDGFHTSDESEVDE